MRLCHCHPGVKLFPFLLKLFIQFSIIHIFKNFFYRSVLCLYPPAPHCPPYFAISVVRGSGVVTPRGDCLGPTGPALAVPVGTGRPPTLSSTIVWARGCAGVGWTFWVSYWGRADLVQDSGCLCSVCTPRLGWTGSSPHIISSAGAASLPTIPMRTRGLSTLAFFILLMWTRLFSNLPNFKLTDTTVFIYDTKEVFVSDLWFIL